MNVRTIQCVVFVVSLFFIFSNVNANDDRSSGDIGSKRMEKNIIDMLQSKEAQSRFAAANNAINFLKPKGISPEVKTALLDAARAELDRPFTEDTARIIQKCITAVFDNITTDDKNSLEELHKRIEAIQDSWAQTAILPLLKNALDQAKVERVVYQKIKELKARLHSKQESAKSSVPFPEDLERILKGLDPSVTSIESSIETLKSTEALVISQDIQAASATAASENTKDRKVRKQRFWELLSEKNSPANVDQSSPKRSLLKPSETSKKNLWKNETPQTTQRRLIRELLYSAMEDETMQKEPRASVFIAALSALEPLATPEDAPEIRDFLNELYNQHNQEDASKSEWTTEAEPYFTEILEKLEPSEIKANARKPKKSAFDSKTILERAENDIGKEMLKPLMTGNLDGEKTFSEAVLSKREARHGKPWIQFRKDKIKEILLVWARSKRGIPILVGPKGSGKTTLAQDLVTALSELDLPSDQLMADLFSHEFIALRTSVDLINQIVSPHVSESALTNALELYMRSVNELQKTTGKRIVVYIEKIHDLNERQQERLNYWVQESSALFVFGESTPTKVTKLTSGDVSIKNSFVTVEVPAFESKQSLATLIDRREEVQKRYRIELSDEVLDIIVKLSPKAYPDLARPLADVTLLDEFCVSYSVENKIQVSGSFKKPTASDIYSFVAKLSKIPLNPKNPKEYVQFIENARREIKEVMVGQAHAVDEVVNAANAVLTADPEKGVRTVVLLGTSGTGKTRMLEETCKKIFKGNCLMIDGTAYSEKHMEAVLFGLGNEIKGVLPEYFGGPGKDVGMVIFNEIEKAHPDIFKRLMEFMDKKGLTGGDGQNYKPKHLLMGLTSNRRADIIFNKDSGQGLSNDDLDKRVRSFTSDEIKRSFTESDGYASLDRNRIPPEVAHRAEYWIYLKPTTLPDAVAIAKRSAREFAKRTHESGTALDIEVNDHAIDVLSKVSFVLGDGARPVIQQVEKILEQVRNLAWKKLDVVADSKIIVDVEQSSMAHYTFKVYDQTNISDPNTRGPLIGEVPLEDAGQYMAIYDPRFIEKLNQLENNMAQDIIGQKEAIEAVSRVVRAKKTLQLNARPVTSLILGALDEVLEFSRSLAKQMYGSEKRMKDFDCARIQDFKGIWNLLNPDKGYLGSDTKSELQKILEGFDKEGGVIVLKNFTKMARSAPPSERESVYRIFEALFSQGEWIDHISGKAWKLGKHIFILTGEDGMEDIYRMSNEDMQVAVHEEISKRAELEKILRAAGIPEGFLRQMLSLVMLKPTKKLERIEIVERLLKNLQSVIKDQKGVDLTWTSRFKTHMAEGFFPFGKGAAGAERFVMDELGDFIAKEFLPKFSPKPMGEGSVGSIELDMELNFPVKAWSVDKITEPEATLRGTAHAKTTNVEDLIFTAESKYTPTSAPTLIKEDVARFTAIHEAWHALINEHSGKPAGNLKHLTIEARGGFGGYARYDRKETEWYPNIETIVRSLAGTIAGGIGMELFSDYYSKKGETTRNTGWNNDLGKMRKNTLWAMLSSSLIRGYEFLPVWKMDAERSDIGDTLETVFEKLPGDLQKFFIKEGQKFFDAARNLAIEIMSDPEVQKQFHAVVAHLMDKGSIDEKEYQQIIGKYRVPEKVFRDFFNKNDFIKENECNLVLKK